MTSLKTIHIATLPVIKKPRNSILFHIKELKLNTNFSSRDNLKYWRCNVIRVKPYCSDLVQL